MAYSISQRTLEAVAVVVAELDRRGEAITAPVVAQVAGIAERTAAEALRRLSRSAMPGRPLTADVPPKALRRLHTEAAGQEAADAYTLSKIGRGRQLSTRSALQWCSTAYRPTATAYLWDEERAGARRPADMPARIRYFDDLPTPELLTRLRRLKQLEGALLNVGASREETAHNLAILFNCSQAIVASALRRLA